MNLSANQIAIVEAPIGISIQVLASAGSGKTRVLTERIRHIVQKTKKDKIIALTFTNKAAGEMLSRLSDLEGVEDRCWIATVHSVAQRILEQYGHTIGLPADLQIYERDLDRKAVFLQSLRDSGVDIDEFLNVDDHNLKKNRSKIIQDYMDNFSLVKRELLSESEVKSRFRDAGFWSTFQTYQQALLSSGGIDFDDILVYAHRILLEQPWCGDIYRAKYKHLCIDEAQDLNKAQYEFVKALCGDGVTSIFMVGDPNQMIYGFNGSSHQYLCESFVKDFSPAQFALNQNYRSSQSVIRLANKIKPGSQEVSSFALKGYELIQDLADEQQEASWICKTILDLVAHATHPEIEGDIDFSKMVVIARNRFVFTTLEEELRANSVPYFLKKGERLTEPTTVFGKVLDLSIRLKLNPKDWVDGKKLFATLGVNPPASWGGRNILLDLAGLVDRSAIPLADIQILLLKAIHDLNTDQPNIPKMHAFFKDTLEAVGSTHSIEVDEEIALSLQELEEFRAFWTYFKRKGLGDSLLAFRNAMALGQLSEEFDPKGLMLSTVHTMKGLEKDIVFLMGMCEGVFPDYRAKSQQELDEEKNNAFVAVTRSRRWIYITYPRFKKMPWGDVKPQRPSRFINLMRQ